MPPASRAVITLVPPSQQRGEPRGDDASRAQPYNAEAGRQWMSRKGPRKRMKPPPANHTARPPRRDHRQQASGTLTPHPAQYTRPPPSKESSVRGGHSRDRKHQLKGRGVPAWEETSKDPPSGGLGVAQWMRVHLSTQGTWARVLAWQDPTCFRGAQPVSHSCRACAPEPGGREHRGPRSRAPSCATRAAPDTRSLGTTATG